MKTRITAIMAVLLLTFSAAFFTGCADGEMTRVTINLSKNEQSVMRKGVFERLVSFFVKDSYALGGSTWAPDHTSVVITVSGEGMVPIFAELPQSAQYYSMEVPSGSQRLFSIIAYDNTERNTGGRLKVDLVPGEEVFIQIRMLPIPTTFNSETGRFIWSAISEASKYLVYESSQLIGGYQLVGESLNPEPDWSSAKSGHYYQVSAYYADFVEGEKSNPFYMPMP